MSFLVAQNWTTITDGEREPLRKTVERLVGYPCKLAMNYDEGDSATGEEPCVEIYVMNVRKGEITDWLELQPSGAFGIVDELYPTTTPDRYMDKIEARCNSLNRENHCTFVEGNESSTGSDEDEESTTESLSPSCNNINKER